MLITRFWLSIHSQGSVGLIPSHLDTDTVDEVNGWKLYQWHLVLCTSCRHGWKLYQWHLVLCTSCRHSYYFNLLWNTQSQSVIADKAGWNSGVWDHTIVSCSLSLMSFLISNSAVLPVFCSNLVKQLRSHYDNNNILIGHSHSLIELFMIIGVSHNGKIAQ